MAAVLSAGMLLNTIPAYAEVKGPREPADRGKTEAELNGFTEERWAQLMDNTLSYDEIDDLVHNFNPMITSAWANLNDVKDLMGTITDELRARRRDMTQLKEKAKAEYEFEDYANYYMQEIILQKTADAMSKSVNSMDKEITASNRPLREAERQVSVGVRQLMIAWNNLSEQRAIVADSVEMYEKLRNDAAARLGVGLATELDVKTAEASLLQARSQLSALDAAAEPLKKNLILLCGWSADAEPVIEAVPDADPARMDAMDPETDLQKAIANNGTLINWRHGAHDLSTASMKNRNRTEESMNDNLLVNLRSLYEECRAARSGWEAAKNGLQAAEITKNAGDLQYQMGMISTAQYLGILTQYQSARTAMNTADSSFFQAMEAYDWALLGIASVE